VRNKRVVCPPRRCLQGLFVDSTADQKAGFRPFPREGSKPLRGGCPGRGAEVPRDPLIANRTFQGRDVEFPQDVGGGFAGPVLRPATLVPPLAVPNPRAWCWRSPSVRISASWLRNMAAIFALFASKVAISAFEVAEGSMVSRSVRATGQVFCRCLFRSGSQPSVQSTIS